MLTPDRPRFRAIFPIAWVRNTSPAAVKPLDEAGCAVVFCNQQVKAIKAEDSTITVPGAEVLSGQLKPTTGLCMTDLHDGVDHNSNITADKISTKGTAHVAAQSTLPHPRCKNTGSPAQEHLMHRANVLRLRTVPALINFHHVTLGAPPVQTWLEGIRKGWFSSWPGVTAARVRKCCANKPQTSHGHTQSLRQHTQSTESPEDHECVPNEEAGIKLEAKGA